MKQEQKHGFFGYILKKEQLESVDDSLQQQSSVLLASNPFPGLTEKISRNIFYLIIKANKLQNNEELIRITQNINQNHNKNINASSCELTIYNKLFNAIRLYNHKSSELNDTIDLYKTYGISFQANQMVQPFISLIKIYKYFELVEEQESIYVSLKDAKFHYLKIPCKLNLEEFDQLINQTKDKGLYHNCDFALAEFHSKEGFDYYIRIFSADCSLSRQNEFRAYILKSIETLTLKQNI